MGVPAITAGKGYYSGFDIALEPNSKKEYFALLTELSNVVPLNENTKRKAACLLYFVSKNKFHSKILPQKHLFPGDDFDEGYYRGIEEIKERLISGALMRDDFYFSVMKDVKLCDVSI